MTNVFQWMRKSADKIYSHKDDDQLSSDSISMSRTQCVCLDYLHPLPSSYPVVYEMLMNL